MALKNVGRFGYWFVPEINADLETWFPFLHDGPDPTRHDPVLLELLRHRDREYASKEAHDYLEKMYREAHEAGDESAIFDYVSEDRWAFRSEWLVHEIERLANVSQGARLVALMRAYANNRGKRTQATLYDEVTRDQRVFAAVLDKCESEGDKVTAAVPVVAAAMNLSVPSVWEIYNQYGPLKRALVPARYSTRDLFFAVLKVMADNLAPQ
jgi:hypothetical protein